RVRLFGLRDQELPARWRVWGILYLRCQAPRHSVGRGSSELQVRRPGRREVLIDRQISNEGAPAQTGAFSFGSIRACPQLEDSQAYYRVIRRRSADSELTDAPLRPSGRSMGQDQGYFART